MRKPAVAAIILLLFSLPMLYITPGTTPDQTTETTTTTITSQRGGGTNYTVSLLTNQNFTGSATGWNYEEWGNNPEAASGSYFTTDYYGYPTSPAGSVLLRLQYTSRQCELGWTQPFTYSGTTPVLSACLTFRWKCYSYTYAGSTNYVEIYLECPKGSGNWQLITHTHFYSSTVWNYESKDISYYLNTYGPGTYQFEADAYLTTASSGTPNVRVLYDDVGIRVKYNVPSSPTDLSVKINNDATYTNNRLVTLSLGASGADQMCFSNSSGGPWTSWESFATTKQVYLTLGDGSKNIYFKAKNTVGETGPVSDSIIYDGSPPNMPSLTSPADGTALKNNAPTFQWSSVTDNGPSGTANYTLQIDTSTSFSSGNLRTITGITGPSYTVTTPLGDGTWYWHVKAVDNAGNLGDWSSPYRVIIIDTVYPTTPTLAIPTSGTATNNNKTTFTWNAANDATSGIANYTLQLDTTSQFNSGNMRTVNVTSGTSTTLTSALADGTWYWRVRATDKAGNVGSYSGYWSIVIDTVKPGSPTLSSPSNGAETNVNAPTFTWSAASDHDPSSGITYTLQIDNSTSFNNAYGGLRTITGLAGTSYTIPSGSPLSDGTWYWHVRAVDNAGNLGDYSASSYIIIVDTANPGAPNLVNPPIGSATNNSKPTFTWSTASDPPPSSGITYTLQLDTSPLFNNATGKLRTITGIIGISYSITTPLVDGTWYWRVRAVDNAGNLGSYSGYRSIVIDTVKPGSPTLTSPLSGSATNYGKPTFTWDAASDGTSGVASYILQYDNSSSFDNATGGLRTIPNITGTSYTLLSALTDGLWYWHVAAVDRAGNQGDYSSYFNVAVDTHAPDAPILSTPANGTTISDTNTPTFTWGAATDPSPSSGIASYVLQIDTSTTFNSGNLRNITGIATTSYKVVTPLSDATWWYWRVIAIDKAGNSGTYWAIWSVYVLTAASGAPTLLSPSNGYKTNNNETTFQWTKVTATDYNLYVDTTPFFNSTDLFVKRNTPGNYTLETTEALHDGTWYWKVAANPGSYNSTVWSIVIDTKKPSATPSNPTNGFNAKYATPTFTWNSNDPSPSSGIASYTLQLDTSTSFNNATDKLRTIIGMTGTSYTVPTGSPLSDGTWYWRVNATDNAGNKGSYSGYWSIVIDTVSPDLPTLTGPPTGSATNHNKPTLTWSFANDPIPSSGVTYTLQYSQDPNFVTGVTTVPGLGLSYAFTSSLDDGTWYWRVRAVDNASNTGSYSGNWSITVDTVAPGLPTLSSPNGGTQTNITRPVLVWNPATDATSGVANYTLQYANSPSFTGAKTVNVTTGTSYTLNTTLGDGTWYWRVKATDKAGNSGSYSGYSNFTVDTQPPTGLTLSAVVGSYTNSLTITLSISATGAQNMSLSSDGVNWVEYNFNASKLWTLSAGDGAKQVYMKCRDAAGNIAYLPGQYIQIILDTIPPAPPKASESPWIPAPGSVTSSNKTALQWPAGSDGDGSGIASYSLQIDTTPTFGSPNMRQKSGLTGTNYTISSALNDGIWYWRINATDRAGNTGPYSTFSSFNISTIPPDRVKSGYKPANNSLLNLVSPLFQWDKVIGAYRYHIQIDRSLNFNTSYLIENVNLSSNRFSPSIDNNKALNDSIWYWRVEALSFSRAPSGYSNISILTIDLTPPSNPQPISPPDQGATNEVNSHKFQWSKVQDATNYWVQLDSTPDFNSSDLYVLPGIEDPNCTINRKLDYGYWYWHVVALDPAGNIGDFLTTPTCRFIVDTISPSQPTPRSPVEGYLTNRTSLKLTWYEASDPTFNGVSSGVANYTLWLDNTTAFNSDNLRKITKLIGTSYNLTSPLRDGTWYWFVNATDRAGNTGPGSIIQRFTIDTVPPSPPPILSMSPNGVTVYVSKVTLTWNASSDPSGVTGYMIQIDISDKFDSVDRLEYKIGNQTTFTPDKELPNGQWYWRIAAIDAAGNLGAWSAPPVPFVVNVVAGLSPMMIVIVGGGSSGAAILAVLGYVFYRRAKIPFVIKKIDQSIKLINKGEMPPPVPMRSRAEIVQTIFQDKVAILSKEKIEELEAKKGKRAPEKPEEPTEKKALEAKPKEAEPKKEVEAKPKAAKTVTPSEAEEANVDMIVKELEKLETKEEVEPSKESEFIRREREELEKPKKKKKE